MLYLIGGSDMFVSVAALTSQIDKELIYLSEARENKDNFDIEVFNSYEARMLDTINARFKKLCSISSNKKVIAKYENKLNSMGIL